MPLTLPNLDRRRYDDLVREALAIIPAIAPEWTNHNASDPGITVLELLAYLTEILLYRVNQIGDSQLKVFASLLAEKPATDRPAAEQVREAVKEIRRMARAVTCGDFEKLAQDCGGDRVARAHCLAGYNLTTRMDDHRRAGHVSIVILPKAETNERHPRPSPELLSDIHRLLEPYRLITTRLHVVGPHYVPIRIAPAVVLKENASELESRGKVDSALEDFLDVYKGGQTSPPGPLLPALPSTTRREWGWRFGGDIYVSHLYEVIERQPGVDYVSGLTLETDDSWRYMRNAKGEILGIDLRENELPIAHIHSARTKFPTRGFER